MNLGVMTTKDNSTFPKAPGLDPYHQIQFSVTLKTIIGAGILPILKNTVDLFHSPSREGGVWDWKFEINYGQFHESRLQMREQNWCKWDLFSSGDLMRVDLFFQTFVRLDSHHSFKSKQNTTQKL